MPVWELPLHLLRASHWCDRAALSHQWLRTLLEVRRFLPGMVAQQDASTWNCTGSATRARCLSIKLNTVATTVQHGPFHLPVKWRPYELVNVLVRASEVEFISVETLVVITWVFMPCHAQWAYQLL